MIHNANCSCVYRLQLILRFCDSLVAIFDVFGYNWYLHSLTDLLHGWARHYLGTDSSELAEIWPDYAQTVEFPGLRLGEAQTIQLQKKGDTVNNIFLSKWNNTLENTSIWYSATPRHFLI